MLFRSDFTLSEDGKARPIVAFSAVELPPRVDPAAAPWKRDAIADVATNEIPQEGRLVIILMDRSIPDGFPTVNAHAIAKAAVNQLGSGDLAAVVFTSGGGSFQGFTSDRQKLVSAIEGRGIAGEVSAAAEETWNAHLAALENGTGNNPGLAAMPFGMDCSCGACVLQGITRIADAVRDAGGRRRKSLLFIGRDLQIETVAPACIDPVRKARDQMYRSLDLASLTVHAFDPGGVETPLTATPSPRGIRNLGLPNLERQGNISVLPDRTGGRTVLNNNDGNMRVPEVMAESESYYLIGFQPAEADGQRHNISVKVNQRGVDVRTRKAFLATPHAAPAPLPTEPGVAARNAINGLLPERNGVRLAAQFSPVADPITREPVLAVVLHVEHDEQDAIGGSLPVLPGQTEQVDVVTSVLAAGGRTVGTLRQTLNVKPRIAGGAATYDVLQRLDARPGRYELRMGLTNQTRRQSGSVYAFVDIPDYRETPFAMSEIGLFSPTGATAMKEDLAELLPAPPTARRRFGRSESITAFVRVSQFSDGAAPTVYLNVRVLDQKNRQRFGQETSLVAPQFVEHHADYVAELPLSGLEPGEYFLEVQAKSGSRTLTKNVIFRVE